MRQIGRVRGAGPSDGVRHVGLGWREEEVDGAAARIPGGYCDAAVCNADGGHIPSGGRGEASRRLVCYG